MTKKSKIEPELKIIKIAKDKFGFKGATDQLHIFGVTTRSQVDLNSMAANYSPCPYAFDELQSLFKLVRLFERYRCDSFNVLVPKSGMGPLILESAKSPQLYMLAPQNRPYFRIEGERQDEKDTLITEIRLDAVDKAKTLKEAMNSMLHDFEMMQEDADPRLRIAAVAGQVYISKLKQLMAKGLK